MRVTSGRAGRDRIITLYARFSIPYFTPYTCRSGDDGFRVAGITVENFAVQTEAGGISLSENTARFLRKVATQIEKRTLLVLRQTKNEEAIPRLGGRGAELVSSCNPDRATPLPSRLLP